MDVLIIVGFIVAFAVFLVLFLKGKITKGKISKDGVEMIGPEATVPPPELSPEQAANLIQQALDSDGDVEASYGTLTLRRLTPQNPSYNQSNGNPIPFRRRSKPGDQDNAG